MTICHPQNTTISNDDDVKKANKDMLSGSNSYPQWHLELSYLPTKLK